MAPEQATADPAIDHRADIYALGVVAYEILVGRRPFTGNAQQVLAGHLTRKPEALSARRDTVPAALEAIVMRCLEKNPADRPQGADEVLRALDALATTAPGDCPRAAGRRRAHGETAVGSSDRGSGRRGDSDGVGVAWFARVGRAGTLIGDDVLAENDIVLVSEFVNRTTDSTLAATITDAIRVELQQSRAVRVMSQAAMWAGLGRMGLEHGTALPEPKVQELAEREGAKAFIVGEISRLGAGYQITARVVATSSGGEALTARATAANENELIGAVEKVGRELRRGIGESLRSVLTAPALAQVTTASLPALRAFTAAQRFHNEGNFRQAVALGKEAVVLDSTFAGAYSQMYASYINLNAVGEATNAARRAFELRERLPEFERLKIEARYHDTRGDVQAEEAAWVRLAALGREETNYAAMLAEVGRLREAEVMAERAVVSTPKAAVAYWNLAEMQIAQHRFAAADSTLARLKENLPENPYRYFVASAILWGRRDLDVVESWLNSEDGQRLPNRQVQQCTLDLQRGRLRAWQACPSKNDLVYRNPMTVMAEFRMTGDTMRAREGYATFLATAPDERNPDYYARTIVLLADVGHVREANKLLDEWRASTGPSHPGYRADSAQAVGAIAAAEGQWDRAVSAFLTWHASRPGGAMMLYNRGLPEAAAILARTGKPDSAIVLFERALATSSAYAGGVYESGWYAQALLMLGDLYEARGDRAKAAEYYQRHIDVFKDPDPPIAKQVAAVREKLARVTGEPGAARSVRPSAFRNGCPRALRLGAFAQGCGS